MSDAGKAVFLSYASQDAEAARRIAEALRAAGVEVWFDQNELVGGDAWDQKIRQQIRECALLIPIISKTTQGRREAYFRLEWKLADERTHLMAKGTPFLLPVTIDETSDRGALVPDSFLSVQWTKLPGGETTPAFAVRVNKLLHDETDTGRLHQAVRAVGQLPTAKANRPWLLPVLLGLFAAVILGIWQPWRKDQPGKAGSASTAPPATLSEARKLSTKAIDLIDNDLLAGRENYRLAEELARKATSLDPTDGEAWAILARVLAETWGRNYDSSPHMREQARMAVDRANQLAPASAETGLAAGTYQILNGQQTEAERVARDTLAHHPTDQRCIRQLAEACLGNNKEAEALELWHRSEAMIGGDSIALAREAGHNRRQMRLVEAEALVNRSMELAPSYFGYLLRLLLLMELDERDRALPVVQQIPTRLQQEDVFAALIAQFWLFRSEPDRALEILERVPRDFFEEQRQYMPKGWMTGWALQVAGRQTAAKSEWTHALAVVEKRLQTEPNRRDLVLYRSRLLALLGQRSEAEAAVQLASELNGGDKVGAAISTANVRVCLGDNEAAVVLLVNAMNDPTELFTHGLWANLKYHPMYAAIRGDPRIQRLVAIGEDRLRQLRAGVSTASSLPDDKTVAVLAFTNLSDDKGNEYFSDGISEELLNVLAKVQGLKVTARTSSFHFKGKDTPIPEIARQLGVAYVLEGSVRKAGEKVRITAQLIKAVDGFHVWSDTFTRDLKDIFAVQDEIAGLIAKNLQLKMGLTAATTTKPIDPVAYQEYLAGRAAAEVGTEEKAKSALVHFQRALGLEPTFTSAWVQMALTYVHLGRWGGVPSETGWSEAIRAAEKAQALEPDSPDVLLAVGWVRRSAEWNWLGAEQAYRRALQLRPNHAETLVALGVLLANLGRNEEAIALAQRAYALDPLNAETQADLLNIYFVNERFSEAVQAGRRAVQLAPSSAHTHGWLAIALAYMHQYAEAEAEANMEPEAINRLLAQGIVLVKQKRFDEARAKVREMEARAESLQGAENVHISIAYLYSELGDTSKAVDSFIQTIADRDPSIAWARTGFFHNLDRDPRWKGVLNKIGLADDQVK